MDERLTATKIENKYLRDKGFMVIEMLEHKFREMLKTNADLSDFAKKVEIPEKIFNRYALYRGRTEPCVMYHKAGPGESMCLNRSVYQ